MCPLSYLIGITHAQVSGTRNFHEGDTRSKFWYKFMVSETCTEYSCVLIGASFYRRTKHVQESTTHAEETCTNFWYQVLERTMSPQLGLHTLVVPLRAVTYDHNESACMPSLKKHYIVLEARRLRDMPTTTLHRGKFASFRPTL